MFINWNDYELIYLMKDGSERAKQVFYDKYMHLIYKVYLKHHLNQSLLFQDFMQECLMVLEKVVYRYNDQIPIRFYTYYHLILNNLAIKLKKKKEIQLMEESCQYLETEPSFHAKQDGMLYILKKEFEHEDNLKQNLFDFCFVRGGSLAQFCKEFSLNYMQTYYLYKKMELQIEKILTKWLE